MAKGGRPKKQPHEVRDARLPAVRLTTAERIDLEAKASRLGVDLSEWIRIELLGAPIRRGPSPTDASLVTELNRIGVNLNQIARQINRGRDHDPHHLSHVLHQLHQALESVTRRYGS